MLAYWMKGKDQEVLFHLLDTIMSKLAPKIEVGPEE